ncbi:TetR/AcrR family transcriptional regulator [Streptomyces sp. HNM0663]|uniref:TetR/AcrR family transcriptional regulator n=1 Tax=Streptomyces chengmaiensis TaxID=3040919 RepID=A0ABT6HGY0_9ACTN|nr:TetR/AcrR family transcriptional regulator [Streptomyces chengmaiensis]MDH2387938.1 TetR/AcrR family transcriptional regulator [Streptomyces chengmaiensis]
MPDIKHFDADATLDTVVRLFWRDGMVSTGIQDVVSATGVNRSSLYATFGGKQELYRAALRRYAERRSQPAFRRLAEDERGLPAVRDFFAELIEACCHGEYARWGCMISNAHAGAESGDPEVRALLDRLYRELRGSLHAALVTAGRLNQLDPGVDPDSMAEALALLAHGVNLRSRAGVDARTLHRTVTATLDAIGAIGGHGTTAP